MQADLIHPTAIIEPGAKLASGVKVGAYSIVGPNVEIGENTTIAPHVVIEGYTKIGASNQIFQFASIGSIPQDLKYSGEKSLLKIGDRNIIREYVTLQPGTKGGGMETVIGDRNLFMANSHVGHDARIGNFNIFANSAAVAGHINIGNYVIVGGLSGIHQYVNLGDHSLIAGGAMVSKDVPPFCYVQGDRAGLVGINRIGLQRNGIADNDIQLIKKAYRELFLTSGPLSLRIERTKERYASNYYCEQLINFVVHSKRGVAPTRRSASGGIGGIEG